jgi:hypothetical protein
MPQNTTLRDAYRFPGCHPLQQVQADAHAFVVTLKRRRKKVSVAVADSRFDASTIRIYVKREIWIVVIVRCSWSSLTVACSALGAV